MTGHDPGWKQPDGNGPLTSWPHRSFLGSLTSGDRQALLALGIGRDYPSGRSILRQGEEGAIVVLILSGIAKINLVAESGTEVLVGIRGAGELLGEMAALSGESRSASAVAATRVSARVIKAGPFLGYLGRSPRVASQLTQMMADRLRAANQHRLELSSYPVEGRIARVLSEVALAHGHQQGTARRIGPEITQADLASLAAASVRTVEKVLKTFEQEGLVVRKRRDLIVVDPVALAGKAEYF
jgi:CRP/FNR family cyclic AMP-dependent transcriptional regulator